MGGTGSLISKAKPSNSIGLQPEIRSCCSVGYDMDELHMLDLKSGTWTSITTKGSKPAARYLHTAVLIDDAMVVYGGNNKACGDVWSFNLTQRSWTKISEVSC